MEIEALTAQGPDPTVSAETTQLKVSAEMQAAMERLFGGNVEDPRFNRSMVDELMEFAMQEGGADSPQALIMVISDLSHQSKLGGKHTMLDRAWHSMKAVQAKRAIEGLSRFD